MVTRRKIKLTGRAYSAVAMHSLRHPNDCVFGMLVGSTTSGNGWFTAFGEAALPLVHGSVIGIPLQLSLAFAVEMAKEVKKDIIGLYFGNAIGTPPNQITPVLKAIVAKLEENLKLPLFVLMVDMTKAAKHDVPIATVVTKTPDDETVEVSSLGRKMAEVAVSNGSHLTFRDFLDHLEDGETFGDDSTWLNKLDATLVDQDRVAV